MRRRKTVFVSRILSQCLARFDGQGLTRRWWWLNGLKCYNRISQFQIKQRIFQAEIRQPFG